MVTKTKTINEVSAFPVSLRAGLSILAGVVQNCSTDTMDGIDRGFSLSIERLYGQLTFVYKKFDVPKPNESRFLVYI
jgi:hypothetical protein